MIRTPIIIPGQVFLNNALNEYGVVTKAVSGDIHYRGIGFAGIQDVEVFLSRFSPVDPIDLDGDESSKLIFLLDRANTKLSIGWIQSDDDCYDLEEL